MNQNENERSFTTAVLILALWACTSSAETGDASGGAGQAPTGNAGSPSFGAGSGATAGGTVGGAGAATGGTSAAATAAGGASGGQAGSFAAGEHVMTKVASSTPSGFQTTKPSARR